MLLARLPFSQKSFLLGVLHFPKCRRKGTALVLLFSHDCRIAGHRFHLLLCTEVGFSLSVCAETIGRSAP